MPLHPQIQGLLQNLAAAGAPAFSANPPAVTRQVFAGLVASLPPSTAVIASVADRNLPGPAGPIPVRVYTPAGAGPHPLLMYFHGGGYVFGDLETHDASCRDLCAGAGTVVVAVDYRLAPEHKFPAASDDCYAATCWVGAHAAEIGGDASRLAVAGDSAGGNLATITALRIRDEGGPKLAAQLLLYPVVDDYRRGQPSMADNAEGYLLTRADIEYMYGHYFSKATDADHPHFAALQVKSLQGLPPALVITAEFDPLRDEGEAYAKKLAADGVDVVQTRYYGAIHGFFSFAAVLDQGRQATTQAANWLRQHLH
ncbi:MAG: alpha/beta hydrolase [Nevskia sp.]